MSSHQKLSIIPNPCTLQVKLMKLHCTHAGFIRAGALYRQKIKEIETRKDSIVIGKDYRGYVAIAATHSPKKPDWRLVKQVAELAAQVYDDPLWVDRLMLEELYSPGHILAIARVTDVYEMTPDNFPESDLEQLVGGWEVGRWAIKLANAIAPTDPIPYKIPGQASVYLTAEKHGWVYEQVMEGVTQSMMGSKNNR